MERTTLFRIASMTKPITSVTALQAMEEGRFKLTDPITRWAPEFANMRVLRSASDTFDESVPAERDITMGDLLSHRAGLTYGDFHEGPIGLAYADALGLQIDSGLSPDNWIAELAKLPLIAQPGARFSYGVATDLLGILLSRIDGKPLGQVLEDRILDPLDMTDTAFDVPPEKRSRVAAAFGFDSDGRPIELGDGPGNSFLQSRPSGLMFQSGGAGLWSTADDYLKFAKLFLNRGEIDGERVLQPETAAMMCTDVLSADQRADAEIGGYNLFAEGHGFGLGAAVVVEPNDAMPFPCGGSEGAIGWPGAFGGWWRADPRRGVILVFLTHCMADVEQRARGLGMGVIGAQAEFAEIAAKAV